MKEKEKGKESFQFDIRAIRLYLEDLENIIKLINKENIEISDENYIYDSLDDLKKNRPNNLEKLSVATIPSYKYPSISIEFVQQKGWHGGVHLRASNDAEYEFLKIKELLLQKKQWYNFLHSENLLGISLAISIISILIAEILKNSILMYIAFISISVSFIYFITSTLYDIIITPMSINIFYRHEKQSFWTRNKDSIIVATLSAVIGAVIGGIIVGLVMQYL